MGTEKLNLISKIGDSIFEFQGAKYFYGNTAVSRIIGVKQKTDRDVGRNQISDPEMTKSYKKYLVRLVAVCAGNVAGVGNQAQRDRKFNIYFYCHPDRVDNAILELKGKSVDRGAGIGRLTIQRVHRPRKVSYI